MAEYPKTAEEYARQLNAEAEKRREGDPAAWGGTLVTDPEHWARYDVRTGEDLARYLAIQNHWDAYKEVHGIRPRGFDYDSMSIEEIQAAVDDMYADAHYLDYEYDNDHWGDLDWPDSMDDYEYEPPEEDPDPLRKMEPDPRDEDESAILDREQDWQHTPKHRGMGRPVEGVVRLGRRELCELVSEAVRRRS